MSRPIAYLSSYRTIVSLACLVITTEAPAQGQHPEPGPYRIAVVRAFLYFNQKDSLSANVIDNPSVGELFNTGSGGGWARSASEEVVIKVEVAGERSRYASGRKIHLTVRKTDGTVLVDRRPGIGLFGDNSDKWFEMFVVYDTGCDSLRIRAEILGQQDSSVVEKHIDFLCGE